MYKIFLIILAIVLVPSLCWGGIDFDGTDDWVDTVSNIQPTPNITICAWVYPHTVASAVTSNIAGCFLYNAGNARGWLFDFYEDDLRLWCGDGGSPNNATWVTKIVINTWQFVGVTDTAGTCVFYYSNAAGTMSSGSTDSTTTTTISYTSVPDLAIGAESLAKGDYFNGIIDELAIWDVALTASEMAQLANSRIKGMPLQVRPVSLQAYWSFNDQPSGTSADGDMVRDLSGNGNNGTGNDGANNTGLTWVGESVLSYPPGIIGN